MREVASSEMAYMPAKKASNSNESGGVKIRHLTGFGGCAVLKKGLSPAAFRLTGALGGLRVRVYKGWLSRL